MDPLANMGFKKLTIGGFLTPWRRTLSFNSRRTAERISPSLWWFIHQAESQRWQTIFCHGEYVCRAAAAASPTPQMHPCQCTYSMFTNMHISTAIRTYCPYMPLANGDRDHLCFSSLPLPPSLSLPLCIFLFIFTVLFEVVITLHVSFDALMNRLFACDALENGNYDSLSFSFSTFLCTLSPVVLLLHLHFHLFDDISSTRLCIIFFVCFSLRIIVSLEYRLPRDPCLRLVFPLSPTHSFFFSLYIIIIAFPDITTLYSFKLFG